MKVAALDLGSNTFLCLIAEVSNGSITNLFEDQVQIVRLGQGLSQPGADGKKKFHPEALARAKKCLTEFSEIIKKAKPDKVLAMATSAARDASNAHLLLEIGKDLGIPIEIIPGDREAQITFQGSTSGQKDKQKNLSVIDIGGGSTEIILGKGAQMVFSKSLDIGCVRLTERFLPQQPADEKNLMQLRDFIKIEIAKYQNAVPMEWKDEVKKMTALAVAGTPTELAKIEIGEFVPNKIDGFKITQGGLANWYKVFSKSNPQQITERYGVSTGRADVILVGVMILQEFCQAFGLNEVEVSTRGVRFGVAIEIERRTRKE